MASEDCRAVGYKYLISVLSFVSMKRNKENQKGRTEAVWAKS